MLTSFFSKSNPINYLLLAVFIFLTYLAVTVRQYTDEITALGIGENLLQIGLCVFSLLLLDFIIRKNTLTLSNTYGIFFFTGFLVCIPVVFSETNILLAHLCVLMALRRIFSLRSGLNTDKKILDASIWITVASFFYFWSLLFLPVLFYAVVRRDGFRFRQLFIPALGGLAVFILVTTGRLLIDDSFDWYASWPKGVGYDFTPYGVTEIWLPITLFATLIVWTGIYALRQMARLPRKDKPMKYLLLLTLSFAILASLAAPNKTGAELLFLTGPLAIVVANYVERLEEFWFKELLLWIALGLPLGLLISTLV